MGVVWPWCTRDRKRIRSCNGNCNELLRYNIILTHVRAGKVGVARSCSGGEEGARDWGPGRGRAGLDNNSCMLDALALPGVRMVARGENTQTVDLWDFMRTTRVLDSLPGA